MAPRAARAARKILGRAMPMVQLTEHRPHREQRPNTASTQALAISRSKRPGAHQGRAPAGPWW